MKHSGKIFFVLVILISSFLLVQFFEEENQFQTFLDKSAPYIGSNVPLKSGFDGTGIKIAIIDTGIDYNHPDLLGFGPEGKVVGGYDFVDNDNSPIDTNGHGTEVAGIIAADGQLKGVAPKAKLLAYRVSENGESVSSELIMKAINRSILDGADIIDISLGVNLTNQKLDSAVTKAVENGVLVVVAAGNHGPNLGTIGSPGVNPNVITVGATYNNITASLVATLEVEDKKYQVIPMVGTSPLNQPVSGKILFGKYGRAQDLIGIDIKDSILLVERGSDIEGELVYFSDKENNAAKLGAKAIVVYNNQPGLFFGELIHEFAPPDYRPTIPAVSLSNGEGLALKELIENNVTGSMNVFYHPDFVAHFSSRGPVSPFYLKPDLVAPGAFVNTTLANGKYNFTSGTSFAAPHVSGASALLLQKKPDFSPNELKSIMATTSDLVSDAYGNRFPVEITGSGRINVTKAFDANLIIEPTYLIFNLSPSKNHQSKFLKIEALDGNTKNIKVWFAENEKIKFSSQITEHGLQITASIDEEFFGTVQDKLFLEQNGIQYNIPLVVNAAKAGVEISEMEGKLNFKVFSSKEWKYAKISALNENNELIDTTTITPQKSSSINLYEVGEYWIESKIKVDEETFEVYDTVNVESITKKNFDLFRILQVPEKPIYIIVAIVIVIALVGLKLRK